MSNICLSLNFNGDFTNFSLVCGDNSGDLHWTTKPGDVTCGVCIQKLVGIAESASGICCKGELHEEDLEALQKAVGEVGLPNGD